MSRPLTWHIDHAKQSQIGQFLQERFSDASSLTKVANRQLKEVKTLLPSFPTSSYPYSTIGMAIDYRIRYSFDLTPGRRLKAWKGAMLLTSVPSIPVNEHGEMVIKQSPYSLQFIQSFFDQLDATVKKIAPVDRRLKGEQDRELARYCYVLSLFEQLYRNFRASFQDSPLIKPVPKQSVDELLAIPEDSWIDDLCALSTLFYDNHHDLLSHRSILNPDFTGIGSISDSDGDLIVDRCLIEIKTSIKSEIKSPMMWQLAGYLLLDNDDNYNIDSVGIYMVRQGVLLPPWSISDFLRLLTGNNTITLTQLRQEFRTLAEKVVNEKRNEEKPVQIIVDQSLPLTWIRQRRLDIAVLDMVLDNFCKKINSDITELKNKVEKYTYYLSKSILAAPSDIDKSILEKVINIEDALIEFSQNDFLIDGGKSIEELCFIVRQLQIGIRDLLSILHSALQ